MRYLVLFLLMVGQLACAAPREIDDYHWTGVERIVAMGDIHGDYDHYISILESAELINSRGKWSGGKAHLVQTGDVPDRGPDTLKIIEHLQKLTKQAKKKGGRVHTLIGNHEAMNVDGDLRYVTPAEFNAFVNGGSESLRDKYFTIVMETMLESDPEGFAQLPPNMRQDWERDHPLGWLEHRQAWNPAWNPKAEIGHWVFEQKVAIQVNDLIFLHGGISGSYCQNSLQSLTEMVVKELRAPNPANPGIATDDNGPLWYRGLSGTEPQADPRTVDAILENHSAKHIVVGHTVTSGVIWPRYDGKVVQIDTGISKAYGGHMAYLEVTPDGLFGGYPNGKIKLPDNDEEREAYLKQVIAMDPDNVRLQNLLASLQLVEEPAPVVETTEETGVPANEGSEETVEGVAVEAQAVIEVVEPLPICGISQ
jgi:hypothetical protein